MTSHNTILRLSTSEDSISQRSGAQLPARAITRVMSPTEANSGVLQGLQCLCPICHEMASEPAMCVNCGDYGHAVCLGLQYLENYAFCGPCMRIVTPQYAIAIEDAHRRQEWHSRVSTQLVTWKSRALEAIGMSASIGVAVGGAAATAVGAAAAAAQGFVQGAQSAMADRPIPPPPLADSSVERAVSLRRPSSAGDLQIITRPEICPRCDFGKHQAHTYQGSCRGLPRSAYFRTGQSGAAIANAPIEGQASASGQVVPLSTELARRNISGPVAIATEPSTSFSTELARRIDVPPRPTEVSRRPESIQTLSRSLVAPGLEAELAHMIETGPGREFRGPPDSFGSAASNAEQQSFYKAPSTPGTPLSRGRGEFPPRVDDSPPEVSLSEVMSELRAQKASIEELRRAMTDVQDGQVRLEPRVTDLEVQWKFQEQVEQGTE